MDKKYGVTAKFWDTLFYDRLNIMGHILPAINAAQDAYLNALRGEMSLLKRFTQRQSESLDIELKNVNTEEIKHLEKSNIKERDKYIKALEAEQKNVYEITNLLGVMIKEAEQYKAEIENRRRKYEPIKETA